MVGMFLQRLQTNLFKHRIVPNKSLYTSPPALSVMFVASIIPHSVDILPVKATIEWCDCGMRLQDNVWRSLMVSQQEFSITWTVDPLELYAISGADRVVHVWLVGQGDAGIETQLKWRSEHSELWTSGTTLNGVNGLSALNRTLLRQRKAFLEWFVVLANISIIIIRSWKITPSIFFLSTCLRLSYFMIPQSIPCMNLISIAASSHLFLLLWSYSQKPCLT